MGVFPDPYLYIVLCLCNHVMLWIWFIWVQRKTACVRQDCSPGRKADMNAITCTRTRQCAVWCFLTGSVWGSCTCLVPPSCSLRGSCRSPFSCSRPERWPALSSKPGNTVVAALIQLTAGCYCEHVRLILIPECEKLLWTFW